jgi:hypothetical protein
MDADLDLLLISVYCTADDLLPTRAHNARRKLTDAEVVTLCVAQVHRYGSVGLFRLDRHTRSRRRGQIRSAEEHLFRGRRESHRESRNISPWSV